MNQTNDNIWEEVMMNQKFNDNSTMWKEDIGYEMINDLYDNVPTKVITILICIFVLTIGNALWFGIIHFELYGGDPKKRSVTNKARELVYCYFVHDCLFQKKLNSRFVLS